MQRLWKKIFSKRASTVSVHEGKKLFKCKYCETGFSQGGSLKIHIASVHEGKKPFKCKNCEASFTQKGNMKTHIASAHVSKK